MTATATVLSGETKTEVKLEPAEESLLKGTGDFKISDDMKVVLSVTPAPMTVRYMPFQKAEAPAATTSAPTGHEGHDMGKMATPAKDDTKK